MKKPQITLQSGFNSPRPFLNSSSSEKLPILRKQHIAKQSTIDSTNSLIHFTLGECLRLITQLKTSFHEDLMIISAKIPAFTDLKQNPSFFVHSKLSNALKYKVHLILSVFPYFSTVTRPSKTFLSHSNSIIGRHNTMVKSLGDLILTLKAAVPTLLLNQTLDFSSEKECLQYFMQIFPSDYFNYQNKECYSPKVLSCLWRYFKYSWTMEQLYENLKLFIYNISIPAMISEEFLLHRAIFEGNLPVVRRLCTRETTQLFYCNPEEQDPLGLTPLMLAIKLNRKDAVLVLTECGCNPKLRANPLVKTPMEQAVSQKAIVMLKYLLIAGQRQRQAQWEAEKHNLLNAIEAIPDFSCEMNWECDSKFIPFAKKLAPSDTYKISKLGSSLRIDMTLAGFSKLKCVRGSLSAIFKGKCSENEGKLLIIDHEKKKIMDLLSDFDMDQLDNSAEELMKNEYLSSEFKAENVDFNPSTNWKGEIHRERISGIETMKFSAKGGLNIQLNRKDYLENINFKEFKDFDEYFAYAVDNSLVKEFNWNKNNSIITNITDLMESDQEYLISLIQNQEECAELKKILELTSGSGKTKDSNSPVVILQEQHKKFLKEFKKSINATIWLTDNFQLQIQHLLPILEILSSISNNIAQFKDFLVSNFIKEAKFFPIKAIIPLFYTLNAVVTFQNFRFIPPQEELFSIDHQYLSKNCEVEDSCYRIKTEGNHNSNSSSNHQKTSFFHDWKAFFQKPPHDTPTKSLKNIETKNLKKEFEFDVYKDDKDDKDSEKSLEVAKALFVNLKNDLVNVFEEPNNNNSSINNSNNNINNSGDLSGSKMKTARCEIPSEKKTTQIKVFTTHNQNMDEQKRIYDPNVSYFPRKEMKKANLTIKIEKTPENLASNIANKVRESKECHNITQLNNESTKNKNKKKFLFKVPESIVNQSLNETKFFPKTTKNQDSKIKTAQNPFFLKSLAETSNQEKQNKTPAISSNKHERIKSLDFNSKTRLLKSEDGDLLKKLHYQKVDILNNEEVICRIKEVLVSNTSNNNEVSDIANNIINTRSDLQKINNNSSIINNNHKSHNIIIGKADPRKEGFQGEGMKSRKKVVDADITYFKK